MGWDFNFNCIQSSAFYPYFKQLRCFFSKSIRIKLGIIKEIFSRVGTLDTYGPHHENSNCKAVQRLCFTTQFLYFINPKFPDSSNLLCLYSLVYVRPGQKLHCWFSHEAAHIIYKTTSQDDRDASVV